MRCTGGKCDVRAGGQREVLTYAELADHDGEPSAFIHTCASGVRVVCSGRMYLDMESADDFRAFESPHRITHQRSRTARFAAIQDAPASLDGTHVFSSLSVARDLVRRSEQA